MGIGAMLGLPGKELQWLRVVGLLYDIGKIGIPEDILRKPGRLTTDEFDEIKKHSAYWRNILHKIKFTEESVEMVWLAAAHHERLDGSGNPDGLSVEQQPFKTRILAVADVIDALTQDRHYREGMPLPKARSVINDMTPHQLDQQCVEAVKRFLGFPSMARAARRR